MTVTPQNVNQESLDNVLHCPTRDNDYLKSSQPYSSEIYVFINKGNGEKALTFTGYPLFFYNIQKRYFSPIALMLSGQRRCFFGTTNVFVFIYLQKNVEIFLIKYYSLFLIDYSHQVQGTIFPAPNFNPIMDAQMLGGALQGFGCDKDMLINILTQRSNAQRLMIAEAYQSMYGRDLIGDLKEKLSDHFKDVMVGLMYPPPSYDAHELWHAMKGAGTEENCLIDILASRTNGEIFQMREAYCLQYSSNLQEDIYSETSGHFRDTLMNLVQGTREEGYTDPALAAQDAMVLWEACQQKTGEHKTMLQMILCNKSYQQLWLVFQEFQNISGQDMVDAINECYDGYFQELLVAIVLCVRDKPAYFAYRLYSAIHDFGFHNKTVIRILIARSEIDLMTIRKRYKERYGKSLFHDIKNFASGHYEKALLAICAGDAEDY
ncbi:annexin A10 [Halichoerus grypus]